MCDKRYFGKYFEMMWKLRCRRSNCVNCWSVTNRRSTCISRCIGVIFAQKKILGPFLFSGKKTRLPFFSPKKWLPPVEKPGPGFFERFEHSLRVEGGDDGGDSTDLTKSIHSFLVCKQLPLCLVHQNSVPQTWVGLGCMIHTFSIRITQILLSLMILKKSAFWASKNS